MKFYQRIRDLREDMDLTQKELAGKLQMHKTTYTNYEQGKHTVPLDFALKLAEFYHVSIDYILKGKGTIRLETYGDLLYALEEISKKFPMTFFPEPVKIKIANSELENVFASWQKLSDLVKRGEIDRELYDMWLQKHIDINATKPI